MDEVIDELLTKDYSCDIAMPRIKKRYLFISIGMWSFKDSSFCVCTIYLKLIFEQLSLVVLLCMEMVSDIFYGYYFCGL